MTWYCDAYCDVKGSSYTKEIEVIIKAGKNVGFMKKSKRPIEPCDRSSQSIFVKKSRDRLGKSMFRITDIRSRWTIEMKGLISCLLRHKNMELVFWYLLAALSLTFSYSYYSCYKGAVKKYDSNTSNVRFNGPNFKTPSQNFKSNPK